MDIDSPTISGSATGVNPVSKVSVLDPSFQHFHSSLSSISSLVSSVRSELRQCVEDSLSASATQRQACATKITALANSFLQLRSVHSLLVSNDETIHHLLSSLRQRVDSSTLELNSVHYQAQHVRKQIAAAKNFQSHVADVELIPESEFFALHPHLKMADAHAVLTARLQHEHAERRAQLDKFQSMNKKKTALLTLLESKKGTLAKVQQQMTALSASTVPLLSTLKLQPECLPIVREAALLPSPLYTLWAALLAWKRMVDEQQKMEMRIDGDVQKAIQWSMTKEDEQLSASSNDANSMEIEEKRPHISASSSSSSNKLTAASLLQFHPLSVCVQLDFRDVLLSLRFKYLTELKLVTVVLNAQLKTLATHATTPITPPAFYHLLTNLYPDDNGLDLPLEVLSFLSPALPPHISRSLRLDISTDGFAYRWCQAIAGLHYLHPRRPAVSSSSFPSASASSSSFQTSLADVFRKLEFRAAFRFALLQSYDLLQQRKFPALVLEEFPKAQAIFVSWNLGKREGWEDTDATDDFFHAIFRRDDVTVHALIRVSVDYPIRPPEFKLSAESTPHHHHHQQQQQTQQRPALPPFISDDVRRLENEINQLDDDRSGPFDPLSAVSLYLLPRQVYALQNAVDILASRSHSSLHNSISFIEQIRSNK